jgi:hypothetical protein
MKQLRQAILWVVLAAIGLMIALSILGAFLGADRAKDLFNSTPLVAFWCALAALLIGGFVFFRRLVATPAGLAMHLGTLLVVAGAMWGSDQAHALRKEWLGGQALTLEGVSAPLHLRAIRAICNPLGITGDKTPSGFMVLFKGQTDNGLMDADMTLRVGTLPYSLRLDDFWIEYYPVPDQPWGLIVLAPVTDAAGQPIHEHQVIVPWKVGEESDVPHTSARLKVLQYLQHARATADGGATADAASPSAAMEVELSVGDRRQHAWLVPHGDEQVVRLDLGPILKNVPAGQGTDEGPDLYFVSPLGDIKAYKSAVTVLAGGQKAGQAVIEVNHPLHWGGYHFYQHSYDKRNEAYTVLHAVSDSGLWAVYLGLTLLVVGAFWRFWLEPAGAYLFSRGRDGR